MIHHLKFIWLTSRSKPSHIVGKTSVAVALAQSELKPEAKLILAKPSTSLSPTGSDQHWSASGFLIRFSTNQDGLQLSWWFFSDQCQDSWSVLTSSYQYWSVLSSSEQCWSVLIRVSTIRMDFNLLQDNCYFFCHIIFSSGAILHWLDNLKIPSPQVQHHYHLHSLHQPLCFLPFFVLYPFFGEQTLSGRTA